MNYAGFWIRALASLVDALVLLPSLLVEFILGKENGTLAFFIYLVIYWLYFALFHSSAWQATPGKRMLGLKVTSETGGQISFGLATGRYFASFLSALIFGFGYFMAGWTKHKQSLHDLIMRTYVLKVLPDQPVFQRTPKILDSQVLVPHGGSIRRQAHGEIWVMAGFTTKGYVVRFRIDLADTKLLDRGLIVGRDSINCDFHINDDSVSRRHARLFFDEDHILLEDLDSTNGTFVNEERLTESRRKRLEREDSIRFGSVTLSIGKE